MNVPSGKVWQPTGDAPVIGCILAGGAARRMGRPKATAPLAGRPLIAYPVEAVAAACERIAVVCKRDTELPPLAAERWDEPDDPRHPIAGLRYALERADAPVFVCAADLPFVTPAACRLIAAELKPGVKAAIASSDGRLQPLLGAYAPDALEALRAAPADEPLTRTVESLLAVSVEVAPEIAFNVNTPDDLGEAERRLRSRSAGSRR